MFEPFSGNLPKDDSPRSNGTKTARLVVFERYWYNMVQCSAGSFLQESQVSKPQFLQNSKAASYIWLLC